MDAFYLQWIGCAFGVFGALLLALNNRLSGWGFVSFLASNVCWIGFGVMTDAPGLIFMQVAFTATSLLGIYRWMLAKPVPNNVNVAQSPNITQNFRKRKLKKRLAIARRTFEAWLLRGYCANGITSFKDLLDSLRNGSVLALCLAATWSAFKYYNERPTIWGGVGHFGPYVWLPIVSIGCAIMLFFVLWQSALLVDRIPIIKLASRKVAFAVVFPAYVAVVSVFMGAPLFFVVSGFIRL